MPSILAASTIPDKLILHKCKILLQAYKAGKLGGEKMPEDSQPEFSSYSTNLSDPIEAKLVYFTLPMALNYQRNSYKLWEAAKLTFEDSNTRNVFNLKWVSGADFNILQKYLLKYKLALQPNKHVQTWYTIANTVYTNWGSILDLIKHVNYDFLQLKKIVQGYYKRGFPYLSGPKIFNYWSYVLTQYADIQIKNADYISIAPDTHIIKASVKLGVITEKEAKTLTRDQIAEKWRELLQGTDILPIHMHTPLWLWSRGRFRYVVDTN